MEANDVLLVIRIVLVQSTDDFFLLEARCPHHFTILMLRAHNLDSNFIWQRFLLLSYALSPGHAGEDSLACNLCNFVLRLDDLTDLRLVIPFVVDHRIIDSESPTKQNTIRKL